MADYNRDPEQGCSFTGHRFIKRSHIDSICDLLDRGIAYAYSCGCRNFFCGGAIGFDTLAAKRVLAFRSTHPDVTLDLILPCFDQDAKWSDSQKREYSEIVTAADTVEYVSTDYYNGVMMHRNRRLVERCKMIIAYAGRPGGSTQTISMAEAVGKKVYNIFPSLEKN